MINHIILLVFLILLTEAINFFKIKYVIFNLFKNTKNLPRIFKNSNSDEKFEVIYFKTAKSILFDSIKILSFLFFL